MMQLPTATTYLTLLLFYSTGAQFYSDYGEGGGGGGGSGVGEHYLYNPQQPYEIPVIYKQTNYPAAYPVAPLIYEVALMKPIEPMPGKKTVPLYMIPEDSLLVNPNSIYSHSREKRDSGGGYGGYPHHHPHPQGLRVNIKYPEFYGLTDGYHIPAVEIPLNKPMIVRQIEVNVLAPEGFMVPFYSEDRHWPYPMNTGCLVAAIPRNTYVSEDSPITIRRLFAVPSLPQYPTYRPAFPSHGSSPYRLGGYPTPPHNSQNQREGLTLNIYQNGEGRGYPGAGAASPARGSAPTPNSPVFELVPITPKSNRRNGGKKNNKNDADYDSDEDKDEDNEDSREKDYSEEDERDGRKCRNGGRSSRRCKSNSNRRSRDKERERNQESSKDRNSSSRNPSNDRQTTTTTTPPSTTPVATSIQDILTAFSSFRDRERERNEKGTRSSASFYEDEERERARENLRNQEQRPRENPGLRGVDKPSRGGGGRGGSEDESRGGLQDVFRDPPRDIPQIETLASSSPRAPVSDAHVEALKEAALQRQINQLQQLLSSLNLSHSGSSGSTTSTTSPN